MDKFFTWVSVSEKSKAEDERKLEELTAKLEEALATRQEAEAKLIHAEKKISELECRVGGAAPPGKVRGLLIGSGSWLIGKEATNSCAVRCLVGCMGDVAVDASLPVMLSSVSCRLSYLMFLTLLNGLSDSSSPNTATATDDGRGTAPAAHAGHGAHAAPAAVPRWARG